RSKLDHRSFPRSYGPSICPVPLPTRSPAPSGRAIATAESWWRRSTSKRKCISVPVFGSWPTAVLRVAAASLNQLAPFSATQLRSLRQVANMPLLACMWGLPVGQVLGRAEQIHQRAVGWTGCASPFHALGIPDPSIRMARAHKPTFVELHFDRGSALVARCFG